MIDLELLAAVRPDVQPMDQTRRDAMFFDLFEESSSEASVPPHSIRFSEIQIRASQPELVTSRRRVLLWGVAASLAAAGLTAVLSHAPAAAPRVSLDQPVATSAGTGLAVLPAATEASPAIPSSSLQFQLVPATLPPGYLIWRIDHDRAYFGGVIRPSSSPTRGTGEVTWSVTATDGGLDSGITSLEQIELHEGIVAYFELRGSTQWLYWEPAPGMMVTLGDARSSLAQEEFVNVARSFQFVDSSRLEAIRSEMAQQVRSRLELINTGEVDGVQVELFGQSGVPAAVCVQEIECQTSTGDVAGNMSASSQVFLLPFRQANGAVDTYGLIKMQIERLTADAGVTFVTHSSPGGTWIHVHRDSTAGPSQITIVPPNGKSGSPVSLGV
jgi:hypothetical protein